MASEVKHTPGPWRVGYRSLHILADNAKAGGDAMICDIRGWGYLTGKGHGALGLSPEQAAEIQDANARLIAAAPELLEAGSALIREFDNIYDVDDGRANIPGDLMVFVDKLRAVVAKAEGK